MHVSRSVATGVLGVVAFLLAGVWGVVNLAEGDWFIGGVLVASAIVGLWSLVVAASTPAEATFTGRVTTSTAVLATVPTTQPDRSGSASDKATYLIRAAWQAQP